MRFFYEFCENIFNIFLKIFDYIYAYMDLLKILNLIILQDKIVGFINTFYTISSSEQIKDRVFKNHRANINDNRFQSD